MLSQDEVLATSLLSSIDPITTSKSEMKEAFCRDVDTFSWDFMEQEKKSDSGHTIDHLLNLHLEYDFASPALTEDKWKEEATKPSSNGPAPRWHGIIVAVMFCVCGVLVAVVLCCGLWQLAVGSSTSHNYNANDPSTEHYQDHPPDYAEVVKYSSPNSPDIHDRQNNTSPISTVDPPSYYDATNNVTS